MGGLGATVCVYAFVAVGMTGAGAACDLVGVAFGSAFLVGFLLSVMEGLALAVAESVTELDTEGDGSAALFFLEHDVAEATMTRPSAPTRILRLMVPELFAIAFSFCLLIRQLLKIIHQQCGLWNPKTTHTPLLGEFQKTYE
jgi:hypothetical protein